MKIFFTFFVLCIAGLNLCAQKNKEKKTGLVATGDKAVWSKGLQFSLYAGQAGGKNWASGSNVFSLSANSFLRGYANRKRGRWFWNNALNASYGFVLTDEYSTVKSDDKLDYFSTLGLDFKKKIKAGKVKRSGWGAAFNFRSQFTNGFDRDYLNQGLKRRTSGFFAPAYITIAPIGFVWHPKHFTFYASPLGFRGVIVSNQPFSYSFAAGTVPVDMVNAKNPSSQERSVAEMYGVDPDKTIRYEIGPYFSLQYDKQVCKNVTLAGRLDVFADINHKTSSDNLKKVIPLPPIDFFLSNTLTFKVNDWINATYSIDAAYDDNIKKFGYFKSSPDLQLKSVLGIGMSLNCIGGSHKAGKVGNMPH
jgi:hypothetical protein